MKVRVHLEPEGETEGFAVPDFDPVVFQDAYMALVTVAPLVNTAVSKGCRQVTLTVSLFEED